VRALIKLGLIQKISVLSSGKLFGTLKSDENNASEVKQLNTYFLQHQIYNCVNRHLSDLMDVFVKP
jgi:hypothetical protein